MLSIAGAVELTTRNASAGNLTPKDFYCRGLGSGTQKNFKNSAFGESMTWDPSVKAAADANPALMDALGRQLQVTLGRPKFYKAGSGSCVSGNKRAAGVCQQIVECAVIAPELKKQVESSYAELNGAKTGFDKIDPETKGRYLAALAPGKLQWLMSSVTCASTGPVGNSGPGCPDPDMCKDDLERDGAQAVTDPRSGAAPLGTLVPDGAPAGVAK